MDEKAALSYLGSLERLGMRLDLSRTERILSFLGNPEKHLKTVHIGGTNGKGSTLNFLFRLLASSGLRVGTYTSPHLHSFTERIALDGKPVSCGELASLTSRVREAAEKSPEPATQFEVLTAAAFLYFREQQPDLVLLEVGLGGRLDATNVVKPELAIITTLDLDHKEVLGSSLAEIAGEKAGIIKEKTPLLSGVLQPAMRELLQKICRRKNAPYIQGSEPLKESERIGTQTFLHHGWPYTIPMNGRHFARNASLALDAFEILLPPTARPPLESLKVALEGAYYPGRMEILSREPLLIVDGAHNPAAMRALKETIQAIPFRNLWFVLGILKDKDIGGMVEPIEKLLPSVILTQSKNPRAATPDRIESFFYAYEKPIYQTANVAAAIEMALTAARPQDLICSAGSLSMAAEMRDYLLKGVPA
ncbi:MAG: bifunctional folylpolyglutamate synthase/dihydrofolate synthase [Desulfobacterales bacterium]|nr:bifunctional folylpolyglutamate synthase/dihydrofolate synthase [Desulfobacterales bacterium]